MVDKNFENIAKNKKNHEVTVLTPNSLIKKTAM
jgi:hypothetical protein